jgi:hypothetical protein
VTVNPPVPAAVLGAGVLETAGPEAVLGAGVLAAGVVGAEFASWELGVLVEQPASASVAVQTQPDSVKGRRRKVITSLRCCSTAQGLTFLVTI